MAVRPDVRVWEFTDRSNKTRSFDQRELTIDGEMALLGLLNKAVHALEDIQFPFDRLGEVFPEGGVASINWVLAGEMVAMVAEAVPGLATDAAAVALGLFPFDEDGQRIPTYEDDKKFLRRTIHVADLLEMVETFVDQNDIERLRGPFVRLYRRFVTPETTSGESSPSTPPSTSSPAAATAPRRISAGATRGRRSTST